MTGPTATGPGVKVSFAGAEGVVRQDRRVGPLVYLVSPESPLCPPWITRD